VLYFVNLHFCWTLFLYIFFTTHNSAGRNDTSRQRHLDKIYGQWGNWSGDSEKIFPKAKRPWRSQEEEEKMSNLVAAQCPRHRIFLPRQVAYADDRSRRLPATVVCKNEKESFSTSL
jgi:hypothetical protein